MKARAAVRAKHFGAHKLGTVEEAHEALAEELLAHLDVALAPPRPSGPGFGSDKRGADREGCGRDLKALAFLKGPEELPAGIRENM